MDKTVVAVLAIAGGILAAPLLAAQLAKHRATSTQEPVLPAATAAVGEEAIVEPPSPPPAMSSGPPVMTRDQFSQIRSGMTYAQCVAVAGVDGAPVDAGHLSPGGKTEAFRWQEPAGPNEFILGFRDGRLSSRSMGMSSACRSRANARLRAQKALEQPVSQAEVQRLEEAAHRTGQPVVITVAEFSRLQPGMTYDECAAIIGAGHPMAQAYAGQRNAALQGRMTLSEGYKWMNPGGYFAEISFRNGHMTRKEWKESGGQAGGGRASGSSHNAPLRDSWGG